MTARHPQHLLALWVVMLVELWGASATAQSSRSFRLRPYDAPATGTLVVDMPCTTVDCVAARNGVLRLSVFARPHIEVSHQPLVGRNDDGVVTVPIIRTMAVGSAPVVVAGAWHGLQFLLAARWPLHIANSEGVCGLGCAPTPLPFASEDFILDGLVQHDVWGDVFVVGGHVQGAVPFGGAGPYGHDHWGRLEASGIAGVRLKAVQVRLKGGVQLRQQAVVHDATIPWAEGRLAAEASLPTWLPNVQMGVRARAPFGGFDRTNTGVEVFVGYQAQDTPARLPVGVVEVRANVGGAIAGSVVNQPIGTGLVTARAGAVVSLHDREDDRSAIDFLFPGRSVYDDNVAKKKKKKKKKTKKKKKSKPKKDGRDHKDGKDGGKDGGNDDEVPDEDVLIPDDASGCPEVEFDLRALPVEAS